MWQYNYCDPNELYHHGVLGMKWGVHRASKRTYSGKEISDYRKRKMSEAPSKAESPRGANKGWYKNAPKSTLIREMRQEDAKAAADGSLTSAGKKKVSAEYKKASVAGDKELAKNYNDLYVNAYNKAVTKMNEGGIDKFNNAQQKKYGDNYAQRKGYDEDYYKSQLAVPYRDHGVLPDIAVRQRGGGGGNTGNPAPFEERG